MYIVILYHDNGKMATHYGPFEDYEEANDYILLGVDPEDVSGSEIVELMTPKRMKLTLFKDVI